MPPRGLIPAERAPPHRVAAVVRRQARHAVRHRVEVAEDHLVHHALSAAQRVAVSVEARAGHTRSHVPGIEGVIVQMQCFCALQG